MPGIIKERLYTPGPTPLLMEAQARTLTATLHHRTEGFRRLMKETLENLRYYFNTKNEVLIFASSGTGAMEGSLSNLLSPGELVLVGTAGKFGERWGQIAKAYDVEALAALVREYPDTCLVVDAITGLGTTDLRPDEWGLDVVIGGSQKATMIPPGLAFASVSEKAWKVMAQAKLPRYYFDFAKERKNLAQGESSFTPATTLVVALHTTLNYIHELGRENLVANAELLAEAARAAAQAFHLKLFAASNPASAVTAVSAPEGMDSGLIVKEIRNRFGAIITNGQGTMKGKIFRLAHLGYYDFLDLISVITALEIALVKLGHKIELGSGVKAAEEVYLSAGKASGAAG